MTTNLKQGQILASGFEILAIKELAEFEAPGIWARHQKSGAEVFHIYNDDSENLFAFAFATPPKDSTGAAHILEHSVLCGSEAYRLKDAFLVLAQGSLNTFLNAFTNLDRTVYPASSMNEHDYFNLMSVYGDAVFRPLLSEWTFMQEGHHLFFASGREGLEISGVVYNEMKGAYSTLDTWAGLWSVKSVMPDTPYEFESGGDPECITDLSWEGLKDFHRSWYSPANCRIFLAGNIPTEKQLDFLNKNFFSSLPPGNRNAPIKKTGKWDSPRSYRIPCPAGAEQKPTVLLSWLCGDITDMDETLGLAALAEILLGHDGSPLARALVDSGLGEDLSPVSGLEVDLRETSFCVGLRGVRASGETGKEVEALILAELERLEREGIPKEEIEAALLGMEFSNREIRRSWGPFSLVWMKRSLRAWIHGGYPWDSLLFAPPFSDLKRRLENDERYFEKMIRRYLLDNPHRAFVVIEPKEGFLEEKDAALKRRLLEKESSLTGPEKEAIINKAEELKKIQEEEDDPKALAAIPHLSRSDLSPDIEIVKREYADASGAPALVHPIFTNGISYVDIAFPLDVLSPADYLWFPFFSRVVVSMGLPGMDYGEVSSLMARTTGGFHGFLHSGSPAPGSERDAAFPSGIFNVRDREWIIFRLKALDEKLGPSLDLALKLITEADFSDLKRLRDLALEMKNDLDSSLAPSGHLYASCYSARSFSRSCVVEELWNGLDQIIFAHKLVTMDTSEICAKLKAIQEALTKAGVLVNYTGANPREAGKEIGKRFGSFGPPKPSVFLDNESDASYGSVAPYGSILTLSKIKSVPGKAKIFASPSLQIGFAAFSLKASAYGSPMQAAELALSHLLSTGPLWEEIRMKGGAYGARAHPDHLEGTFSFATYRDPNPARSLEVFSSIIRETRLDARSWKEAIDKAVIGTYARETHPRSPTEKGLADFLRFLCGIEDSHRSRRLKDLIDLTAGQVDDVMKRLRNEISASGAGGSRDARDHTYPVIITGVSGAEKAAAQLGVEVTNLPA